jgi:hypothetical protein
VPEGMHTVEVRYEGLDPFVFTSSPRVEAPANSVVNFGIAQQKARIFGTVRSDSGEGMPNVIVRIKGTAILQAKTSEHGTFTADLPEAGAYLLSLDPESLPPSYRLDDSLDADVKVSPGEFAEASFVIRALRSIAGKVTCGGVSADTNDLEMVLDGRPVKTAFGPSGTFTLRDIAAGRHELQLKARGTEMRRTVEVGAEPTNIRGADFEICSATGR